MPTPLPAPYLVGVSAPAAELIGLTPQVADSLDILIGNAVPERASRWPPCIRATSSASGPASWATAAPSCLAMSPPRKARWSCNGKAPA
jgi:hypothetical protein